MGNRIRATKPHLFQPVVPVIGDFNPDARAGEFAAEVWAGVVAEFRQQAPDRSRPKVMRQAVEYETILDAVLKAGGSQRAEMLKVHGWGRIARPPTRTPIPLRLAHGRDADTDEFKNKLRQVLDLFDVWGIIASASAHNIDPLRDGLKGVDVPLLVTTDSTTVGSAVTLPTELRLMPSNRAQATVMLLAATTAAVRSATVFKTREEATTQLSPIRYIAETSLQARKYAEDLTTQLREEADRLRLPLEPYRPDDLYEGPLLVVGYDPLAEQLIADRPLNAVTILSDGCATEGVRLAVEKGRPHDADCWFVTAPTVRLSTLGGHSFAAIVEAGQEMAMGKHLGNGTPLATSQRDRIRGFLADADKATFVFEGIENIAPLYLVRSIAKHSSTDGVEYA
jgi:hypothetical protein